VSGWLALVAAGLLEIAWAFGLKYSDGLTRFWPTAATALAIALSFGLMAVALKSLPFGTAYVVWTGIGAVGSILVGILVYSEPVDPVRLLCLTLIVAGMVGLKLNSPCEREPLLTLRAQTPPRFDDAEQAERDHKGQEVIQKTEHQQRREQRLPVFAAEPKQDRGIEHA
jgi:quaternary ammonium compound-resistance protein SugE